MSRFRTDLTFCLCLSSLTLAVFWGILACDFLNYDDIDYVTGNPHVASGLTWANVAWAFTSGHAANWHPLTWLSHMLDVELFGMNSRAHHATNLLLHATNASILYLFLHRISGCRWRSGLVAALFAVHPLHVESVAWVAERKDLLSTFFGFLAVLAYVRYSGRRTVRRYVAVIGSFALSLLAKPMLVTLPFVLLLLDYWPLRRLGQEQKECNGAGDGAEKLPLRRLVGEKIPLFLLTVVSCCITIFVQRGAMLPLGKAPLSLRIANALVSYVRYLARTVFPHDLAALYPLPKTIPPGEVLGCALILLLITFFVCVPSTGRPYLRVGWLWFLGTLVPVIGLVQVGVQSMADRYTYVPLVGLFIIAVWGAAELAGAHASRVIALAVGGTAIIVYGAATMRYVPYWQNGTRLFSHTLAVTTENSYAHYLLGKALYREGNIEEALLHFVKVRQLSPGFADVFVDLGIIHAEQGDEKQAVNDFVSALFLKPDSNSAHYNLAVALQSQGKNEDAIAHYQEALRLDHSDVYSHNNLGVILMRLEKWGEAAAHFTSALQLMPRFEEARLNLQICRKKVAE